MNALILAPLLLATAGTPTLSIDPAAVTVSGLSAGGQMAHQLHVAYSDRFSGAAIIAGGPYGCAEGSVATAFARCMGSTGDGLSADLFESMIAEAAEAGRIADPAGLADDRVWLFHGTRDTVVAAGVSDTLADLYRRLAPAENIRYVDDLPAAHHFPADARGHACGASEPPFIGDCGFDAAGQLLQHLYPGLQEPAGPPGGELLEVALSGAADAGLSDTAWLYVPATCAEQGAVAGAEEAAGERTGCALHLVLHGCAQSAAQIGMSFIEQGGFLEWADANRIVLAFPQVVPGATNPYACWDWWGYTGENYLWREAPQMRLLADWVQSLSGDG